MLSSTHNILTFIKLIQSTAIIKVQDIVYTNMTSTAIFVAFPSAARYSGKKEKHSIQFNIKISFPNKPKGKLVN